MLFLALKQLSSNKKQTFLILLGIGLGTMLFISISGVMLGLRSYIVNALLSNTSHILISGADKVIDANDIKRKLYPDDLLYWGDEPFGKRGQAKLDNYYEWGKILRNNINVYDFSPRLTIPTILTKRGIKNPVSLMGVKPNSHMRISNISHYMTSGSFSDLENGGNKIILGSGVAKNLGVRLNQNVSVSNQPFKVVGIFRFGDERIDSSLSFTNLHEAQKINKTPGRITSIGVSLYDLDKSEEIVKLFSLYTNDKVESWKELNKSFVQIIKMQDIVRYFIMFAVLLVAGFGIYNVLSIMVHQKRNEIATLRSMGYSQKDILYLILYQGIFLGTLGGLTGVSLGFLVVTLISSIDIGLQIGKSNHLVVSYDLSIYIYAFCAAIIASIIASIIPARIASRLSPISILRGQ